MLLVPSILAAAATPPPEPASSDPVLDAWRDSVLARALGTPDLIPAPDPQGLLQNAARALGLSIRDATFTPTLHPDAPLAEALRAWERAHGSPTPAADLERELQRANALPLDLQRAVATLLLTALEAEALSEASLAALTPEERAFAAANREALLLRPESPEGQRMRAIADKVDLAKSVEAALLLVNAVDAAKPVLADWSARLSAPNEADTLIPLLQEYAPLLRANPDPAARIQLASRILAAAGGAPGVPAPYAQPLDEGQPLATALLAFAAGIGIAPDTAFLQEVGMAERLPVDLQRALALVVHAKLDAVLAQQASLDPALTARERAAMNAKAQLDLVSAIQQATPALQFWSEAFQRSPALERAALLNPALTVPYGVQATKALTNPALTPSGALLALLKRQGIEPAPATAYPVLSVTDALRILYTFEGFTLPDADAQQMERDLRALDPRIGRSLEELLNALAFATLETMHATARLTPDERYTLLNDAPLAEGLLAERRGLTPDERAYLLHYMSLADQADLPRMARAALTLLEAAEGAHARLKGLTAPPEEPRSGGSAVLGFLTLLSPIGSARAQSTALTCPGVAFSNCAADVYFQDPAGLVAITGDRTSTFTGRHLLTLDLGGADLYLDNAGGASGGGALTPVSLAIDMGGRDRYENTSSAYVQGAANIGVGLLLDYGPEGDQLIARHRAQGHGLLGIGLLWNEGGDDEYAALEDAQGRGGGVTSPGIGILVDLAGNDRYRARSAQGHGLGGLLLDTAGRDQYGPEDPPIPGVPYAELLPSALGPRADNAIWIAGRAESAGDAGIGLDFDPLDNDRDGDRWPDLAERLAGSDLENAADAPDKGLPRTVQDRTMDSDRDGVADLAERFTGTNPNDASDYFLGIPQIPHWPTPTPLSPLNDMMGMAPAEFVTQFNSGAELAGSQVQNTNLSYARGFLLNVGFPAGPTIPTKNAVPIPVGFDFNTLTLTTGSNRTVEGSASATNGSRTGADVSTAPDAERPNEGRATQTAFADHPFRLLAVGDVIPTTYTADYLLLIDLGGDDTYRNAAGGAVPLGLTFGLKDPVPDPLGGFEDAAGDADSAYVEEPVDRSFEASTRKEWLPTLAIDVSGNDLYSPREALDPVSRGFAPIPALGSRGGILLDYAGDDEYRGGPASEGALGGILLDAQGADTYDARDDSQGSGGLLLDLGTESDHYTAGNRSQGYGGNHPGSTPNEHVSHGLLVDLGGDDTYDTATRIGSETQGVAGPGSVGLLADLAGVDHYHSWGATSQGALAPRDSARYETLASDTLRDDLYQPTDDNGNPEFDASKGPTLPVFKANPNVRRARAGPALAGLVDIGGHDAYENTRPGPTGGIATTNATDLLNDNLRIDRTPARYEVGPANGTIRRTPVVLHWNIALQADASEDDDGNGETGVTSWFGADPSEADDEEAGDDSLDDSLRRGFYVNLPLAGVAIGSAGTTTYTLPYVFTLDLGGHDQYLNNPASLIDETLAVVGPPPDVDNQYEEPAVTATLRPFTAVLDFGGDDTYQARTNASLAAGILGTALLLDSGGANAFLAETRIPGILAPENETAPVLDANHTYQEWPESVPKPLLAPPVPGQAPKAYALNVTHDGAHAYFLLQVPDADPVPGTGGDRVLVTFDKDHNHRTSDGDLAIDFGPIPRVLHREQGEWRVPEARFQLAEGRREHNATATCAGTETEGCWTYELRYPLTRLAPEFLLDADVGVPVGIEIVDAAPGLQRRYEPVSISAWPVVLFTHGNATPAERATHAHPLHAAQGSAAGGVGLLLAAGTSRANDRYVAGYQSQGHAGQNGIALLLDAGGSDRYEALNRSQASILDGSIDPRQPRGGVAALIDLSGSDIYVAGVDSQGHVRTNGTGIRTGAATFLDVSGDDAYKYANHSAKVKGDYPRDGRQGPPASLNGWSWSQGAGRGLDFDGVDTLLAFLGTIPTSQPTCRTEQQSTLAARLNETTGELRAGERACPSEPRPLNAKVTQTFASIREHAPGNEAYPCGEPAPREGGSLARSRVRGTVCLVANVTNGIAAERVDFLLKRTRSEPGIPLGSTATLGPHGYYLVWNSTTFLDDPLSDGPFLVVARVYLAADANPYLRQIPGYPQDLPDRESWMYGAYYEDGVPAAVSLNNDPLATGLALTPGAFSRYAPGNGTAHLGFTLSKDYEEATLSAGGLETDPLVPRGPCPADPAKLCDQITLTLAAFDTLGFTNGVLQSDNLLTAADDTRPVGDGTLPNLEEPESEPEQGYYNCIAGPLQRTLGNDVPLPGGSGGGTIPSTPGLGGLPPAPTRDVDVLDPVGTAEALQRWVGALGAWAPTYVAAVQNYTNSWVGLVTNATGNATGYVQGPLTDYVMVPVDGYLELLVNDPNSCFQSSVAGLADYVATLNDHVTDPPYVVGSYQARLVDIAPVPAIPTVYLTESNATVNAALQNGLDDGLILGPLRTRGTDGAPIAPFEVHLSRNPLLAGQYVTSVRVYEDALEPSPGQPGRFDLKSHLIAEQVSPFYSENASTPKPLAPVQAGQLPLGDVDPREPVGGSLRGANPLKGANPFCDPNAAVRPCNTNSRFNGGTLDEFIRNTLFFASIAQNDRDLKLLLYGMAANATDETLNNSDAILNDTYSADNVYLNATLALYNQYCNKQQLGVDVDGTCRGLEEMARTLGGSIDGIQNSIPILNPGAAPAGAVENWTLFTNLTFVDLAGHAKRFKDEGRACPEAYCLKAGSTLRLSITVQNPGQTGVQELWLGSPEYPTRLVVHALAPSVNGTTVEATLTSLANPDETYDLILRGENGVSATRLAIPGGLYGPGLKTLRWEGEHLSPVTGRAATVPDGTYVLTLHAEDRALGKSTSKALVTVDNTPPATEVLLPEAAGIDLTAGNVLPLRWRSDDADGTGIAHYRVRMRTGDDRPWLDVRPDGSTAIPGTESENNLTFTTTRVGIPLDAGNKSYQFLVVAVDRAGNVENTEGDRSAASLEDAFAAKARSARAATVIDQFRPLILSGGQIRTPGAPAPAAEAGPATPLDVRVCATDADTRVTSVALKVFRSDASGAPIVVTETLRQEASGCFGLAAWNRLLDKARYPGGEWSYFIAVTDLAGNLATTEERPILIDNEPPAVTAYIEYPPKQTAAKSGDEVRLVVKVEDVTQVQVPHVDLTGINLTPANVTLKPAFVDGEPAFAATFVADGNLTDGLHAIPLVVTDAVGNRATGKATLFVATVPVPEPGAAGLSNLSATAASVRFATENESLARVRYGTDPLALTLVAEGDRLTDNHTLDITGLRPSTRYYFVVDTVNAAGVVTEGRLLHNFTTPSALTLNLTTPSPDAPMGRNFTLRWTGGAPDGGSVRYKVYLGERDGPERQVAEFTDRGLDHAYTFSANAFQDGADYVIRLRAETTGDTLDLTSAPFTLDVTAPTLYDETPARFVRDTRPTLGVQVGDAFSGIDPESVRWRMDGAPVDGTAYVEGARAVLVPNGTLAEGPHRVTVEVRDLAGNPATLEWTLTVDATAPVLSLESLRFTPGSTKAAPGSTGRIALAATDAAPIVRATASVAGSSEPVVLVPAGEGRFTGEFPVPATAAQGTHELILAAEDAAGNLATLPHTFTVDATPPKVRGIRLLESTHRGLVLNVVTDEPTTLTVRHGRAAPDVAVEGPETPSADQVVRLTGLIPSSTYRVEVLARDEAGNVARASANFTTTLDTEDPTAVAGLAVRDSGNGRLVLTWPPAEDDVGLAGYRVFRSGPDTDGRFVPIATVESLEHVDAGIPTETLYAYQVAAVDLAGNLGPATEAVQGSSSAIPVLSDGRVTPEAGHKGEPYTYTVRYTNAGNVPPLEIHVLINGVAYPMLPAPGETDYAKGVTFVHQTTLAPHTLGKPHTYSFQATDGKFRVNLHEEAPLKGPLVSDTDAPAAAGDEGFLAGAARAIPDASALLVLAALAIALTLQNAHRRRSK